MYSGNEDNAHIRWKSSTASDKAAWTFFDSNAATCIVREALRNPATTLQDLYHSLSLARMKCEWVKSKKPDTVQQASYYATGEINFLQEGVPTHFGQYRENISSSEPGIYTSDWGQSVLDLALARIGALDDISMNRFVGLSSFTKHYSGTLTHPPEQMLHKLESDFKRLRDEKSFAEFLKIAARMLFVLSNYPAIMRGSAAVNSWIIDKIAREKFQLDLNLRPFRYDWIAFYETLEQYQCYYLIAATGNYLASLPQVFAHDPDFYQTFDDTLILDPNLPENFEKRKKLWIDVKAHISHMLAHSVQSLTPEQMKMLKSLLVCHLPFRAASREFINFLEALKYDPEATLGSADNREINQLTELINLSPKMYLAFQEAYGDNESEDDLNHVWVDIEKWRALDPELQAQVEDFLKIEYIDEEDDKPTSELVIKTLVELLHQPAREVERLNPEMLDFLSKDFTKNSINQRLQARLTTAILSGGIRKIDFERLSLENLEILTSAAALLLYNAQRFIHASDLIDETQAGMEKKILGKIVEHYSEEKIPTIEDPALRKFLLDMHELWRIKAVKMSTLIAETLPQTKRNLLKAWLTYYYQVANLDRLIDTWSDEKINVCLNRLTHLFNSDTTFNSSDCYAIRKYLAENDLSAAAIMQLNPADFNVITSVYLAEKNRLHVANDMLAQLDRVEEHHENLMREMDLLMIVLKSS